MACGAATILKEIERKAVDRNFPECEAALVKLAREVDLLRIGSGIA